ncbi:MAG: PAS domain S-box protein, partial [Armatimonadetes bacterium]|nr:PAS domain S-box protein [Armatimonadota bacterium]
MSLRKKTLWLTGLCLAGLVGVMYLIAVRVLVTGYAAAEQRENEKHVVAVQHLLAQRMDALDAQCHDWSSWDDTYVFAQDGNTAYRNSNITMASLAILKTNLVAWIDVSGRVVHAGWFDFERSTTTPLPAAFQAALGPGSPLLQHPQLAEGQRGLLDSPWGLLMVVSRPILSSDAKGPSRGTLVFGRPLATGGLDPIQSATGFAVWTVPCSSGQLPRDSQSVSSRLTEPGAIVSQAEGDDLIAGYTILPDVGGQPVALLRVAEDRAIYRRGLQGIRDMLVPAMLFGAAFSIIVLFVLERLVLSRVAKLSADVAAVGASEDPGARVSLPGSDELSGLATQINNTLEHLTRSQMRLQESEEQYRDLVETSSDWIWQLDENAVYTYVSPRVRDTLGYEPAEVLGKTPVNLKTPEEAARVGSLFKSSAARREAFVRLENTCLHADGHPVVVETSAVPIFDSSGAWRGYRGVDRDITERKQAERRLARLDILKEDLLRPSPLGEKLQHITNAVVDALGADFARVWITDPGDRCQSGCPHAEITEGPHVCRQRDRCLHLMASSGRYTHLDGQVHARVPFGCYKIGRVAAGDDEKFITNDVTHDPRVHNHAWAAELGLVSFAGYRLTSLEGEHIGVLALFSKHPIGADDDAVLGQIADTTSRVIHIAKVQEAVQASNALQQVTLDTAATAVMRVDPDCTILDINDAFTETTGYTRPDVVGKPCPLPEGGLCPARGEIFGPNSGGRIAGIECRCQAKDGRRLVVRRNAQVLRDQAGRITGGIESFQDITDLVHTREDALASNQ